jgi:hypothetical protein
MGNKTHKNPYNDIRYLKRMIDGSITAAGPKGPACIHYMAGYVGAMQVFGYITQENHDLACDYLQEKINALQNKILASVIN